MLIVEDVALGESRLPVNLVRMLWLWKETKCWNGHLFQLTWIHQEAWTYLGHMVGRTL